MPTANQLMYYPWFQFPFLISPFPHFSFPHYLFLFLGQPGVNIFVTANHHSPIEWIWSVQTRIEPKPWATFKQNLSKVTRPSFPTGKLCQESKGEHPSLVPRPSHPSYAEETCHSSTYPPNIQVCDWFYHLPPRQWTTVHSTYSLLQFCYPWFVDKRNTQANGTTNTAISWQLMLSLN